MNKFVILLVVLSLTLAVGLGHDDEYKDVEERNVLTNTFGRLFNGTKAIFGTAKNFILGDGHPAVGVGRK
ncbi:hypothetical protein RRG08_040431 [Elysia crispata]|uniref:Uncharacterized protein n=1 Tax=Elysia crispata TaxID=231223 RepID=A0AAE0ZCS5_9GAST|nr:hypothetical protein RRG08_040431 [Elysia crispata]